MRLTLDWNCVIAVENGEEVAGAIRDLVELHRVGKIEVALLAASASESTRQKTFPETMQAFNERVTGLGLADLPLVPVPCISSLSYLSPYTLIVDGNEYERITQGLWATMFPGFASDPADHLKSDQKLNSQVIWSPEFRGWRNRFCDVISAYSHIIAARDIFVTSNTDDFQDKGAALAALGMKLVLTPCEALAYVLENSE